VGVDWITLAQDVKNEVLLWRR